MTSRCHWMPFYPCDYLGDTQHLSTEEHGAYLLLIMHYWMRGGLPDNEEHLARICRLSNYRWRKMRDTIAGLFQADWKHKRIDEELARAERKRENKRKAGLVSSQKRWGKPLKNNDVPVTAVTPTSTVTHLDKSKWRAQAWARGERPTPTPAGEPIADVVSEFKPRNDAPPDVPAISEEERLRRIAKVKAALAGFGS